MNQRTANKLAHIYNVLSDVNPKDYDQDYVSMCALGHAYGSFASSYALSLREALNRDDERYLFWSEHYVKKYANGRPVYGMTPKGCQKRIERVLNDNGYELI